MVRVPHAVQVLRSGSQARDFTAFRGPARAAAPRLPIPPATLASSAIAATIAPSAARLCTSSTAARAAPRTIVFY